MIDDKLKPFGAEMQKRTFSHINLHIILKHDAGSGDATNRDHRPAQSIGVLKRFRKTLISFDMMKFAFFHITAPHSNK